jgi:UDP-glucose 4-epimerase
MNVLVVGGSGYIGSHTCIELIKEGFDVTIYDNLSNSHPAVISKINKITGKKINLIQGDVRDEIRLNNVFRQQNYYAVIHFAALKAIEESMRNPLTYYDNNVNGLIALCRAMTTANVKKLVFSSSATVYGEPQFLPLTENHPLESINPYGRTKLFCENILRDLFKADKDWSISVLRYFNPVGAHDSGLIGESPKGTPANFMPYLAQVAIGQQKKLIVFGDDYPTCDGTGVRDYVHVVDLAVGHVKALQSLNYSQCSSINLGTGRGYSVLEVIAAFEKACCRKIQYEFGPRRKGDVASCYADTALAKKLLGWRAQRGIDEMCRDAWLWQLKNPMGYVDT